jgi:hypothetical protein
VKKMSKSNLPGWVLLGVFAVFACWFFGWIGVFSSQKGNTSWVQPTATPAQQPVQPAAQLAATTQLPIIQVKHLNSIGQTLTIESSGQKWYIRFDGRVGTNLQITVNHHGDSQEFPYPVTEQLFQIPQLPGVTAQVTRPVEVTLVFSEQWTEEQQ